MPQPDEHLDLLNRYLDGGAAPEDLASLERWIREDPAAAATLADLCRMDIWLAERFRGDRAASEAQTILRGSRATAARSRVLRLRRVGIGVAAAALAAVGLWAFLRPAGPDPGEPEGPAVIAEVTAGQVTVVGKAAGELYAGDEAATAGERPATLRLTDGSRVTMQPGARAGFIGSKDGCRQVALREGKADFQVNKGGGTFEVATPLGTVRVVGTAFSVGLLARVPYEQASEPSPTGGGALAVAVVSGAVQVDCGGKSYRLGAGDSSLFARLAGGPARLHSITGRIVHVGGGMLSVSASSEKGEKPRGIVLDEGTRVLIETREPVTASNGNSGQRPDVREATQASLQSGQRVTVQYGEDGRAVRVIGFRAAVAAQSQPAAQDMRGAVARGVEYLWARQASDGHWEVKVNRQVSHPLAATSMACCALMEAGVSPGEPRLAKALDWLARAVDDPGYADGACSTYTLGFRCQAWMLANKASGGKYAAALKRDVARIVASTPSGGFDYTCSGEPAFTAARRADNSNSQFALYGVWAGRLDGVGVPGEFWRKMNSYWMLGRNPEGWWGYMAAGRQKRQETRITMVAAGVTSLYVCQGGGDGAGGSAAIDRGLAYLDENFQASLDDPGLYKVSGAMMYYHLFGIQRVGLATGRKRFGASDWYEAGARVLLPLQKHDGSWSGQGHGVIGTAWAVMFLARGQQPMPFVHVSHPAQSPGRAQAVNNLYEWMGRSVGGRYRYRVVKFDDPAADWQEAGVALIAGRADTKFSAPQVQRLRDFVRGGGVLFTCTEDGSGEFSQAVRDLHAALFPWQGAVPVTRRHPLGRGKFDVPATARLYAVADGSGVLAVHSDDDLVKEWQSGPSAANEAAFGVGANVFLLARGGGAASRPAPGASRWFDVPPSRLARWGVPVEPWAGLLAQYRQGLGALEARRREQLAAAGDDSPARAAAGAEFAAAADALRGQLAPKIEQARGRLRDSLAAAVKRLALEHPEDVPDAAAALEALK